MARRSTLKDEQQEKGDIKPHNRVQAVSKNTRTKYDISDVGPQYTSDFEQRQKKLSSATGKEPTKKVSKANPGTFKKEE
eukprot:CAMPEP_0195298994 /NCGR_PEP_ID=MMETSP0707-20130614/24638_1 /TAXON_ID=33640 /ORGANISM="Asterionellopsis glacialis, Strain CCMP134" /LENGTH=78 /DNA_ID=CAMNT_0040361253 /DNA_START=20 /DNA_END=253 /DNA_ORIENTATION=-